jgi:ribosomal protein S18 acetylase RimI-like enzyme
MYLVRFETVWAAQVSTWALTSAETLAWCARPEAPVPAEVIARWGAAEDVHAYAIKDGGDLVAYGELWVDDDEGEVELARVLVAPQRRGRGVGRCLTAALAREARRIHPRVFLRVLPTNAAALRCYAAVGFRPVVPEEAAAWNEGQPAKYAWLRFAPSEP